MTPENNLIEKVQLKNPKLILRDGELFNRKLGLGFFSLSIEGKLEDNIQVSDEPRIIWLPSETAEVQKHIDERKPILLQGSLGSGKSALLYGLRTLSRTNGGPYCYIDGHFKETDEKMIMSSLVWATNNNAPVFFDSLDYLAAGTRKKRKLPLEVHRARSISIIHALENFISYGGVLVATSHTEEWFERYGDQELIRTDWQRLTDKLKMHNVRGRFDNDEEIIQFYRYTTNVTTEEARYLAQIAEGEDFIRFLQRNHPNHADEILESLRSYRLAKLIAFGNSSSTDILAKILSRLKGEYADHEIWEELSYFVVTKNNETILKGGKVPERI